MPFMPKKPWVQQAGCRDIYKGYIEEGEGQYPIAKTKDWVEEDFHGLSERWLLTFSSHLLTSSQGEIFIPKN